MSLARKFGVVPACALAAGSVIATSLTGATPAQASQTSTAAARCKSMAAPVHRAVNPDSRATLLTVWPHEAKQAAKKFGFTADRSTPFKASERPAAGLTPVHRLYQARTHDFLWTASPSEIRSATAKHGYQDSGVNFYASTVGGPCMLPVYRLRKGAIHRYATTAGERDRLKRAGWTYEHVVFYATAPSAPHASAPEKRSVAKKSVENPHSKPKRTPSKAKTSRTPYDRPFALNKYSDAWRAYTKETDPTKKRLLYQIAATPTANWFTGKTTDHIRMAQAMKLAMASHTTPEFVLYAIPHRDCGNYSSGGFSTVKQYKAWIDSFRSTLSRGPAIVILEPDAIGMTCLSASQRSDRYGMLKYAMSTLSSKNVYVYIHAGSSGLSPTRIAASLKKAGISKARGFAVNVSGFDTTASEVKYGKSILKSLGMKKHFVIDTSRNGLGRYVGSNGGAPTWCNPPGRALGVRPTLRTADPSVDAYLWVKSPGGSDGQCHEGDPKGWFQSYALDLAKRSLQHGTVARLKTP